jgi:hypothetical protein
MTGLRGRHGGRDGRRRAGIVVVALVLFSGSCGGGGGGTGYLVPELSAGSPVGVGR